MGRRNSLCGGAVAELPGAVVSPAPKCVVGFGGARMLHSRADLVPHAAGDLSGHRSLDGGPVAELAGAVVAPTPERFVVFGGTCLVRPGADVVPCVASDLCGCVSFSGAVDELTSVIPLGRGPITELTKLVESPTPKCSIRFSSAGMPLARLDGVPRGSGNLSWDI